MTFGSKSDARRTGADGKFQFGDLLPGKYTLRVVPPDGLKTEGRLPRSALTVDGGDIGRADFVLVVDGDADDGVDPDCEALAVGPAPVASKPASDRQPEHIRDESAGARPSRRHSPRR